MTTIEILNLKQILNITNEITIYDYVYKNYTLSIAKHGTKRFFKSRGKYSLTVWDNSKSRRCILEKDKLEKKL